MDCHSVADTIDNCILQVTVTVCHSVAESDTVTITVRTVTKKLWCYPYLEYTLEAPLAAFIPQDQYLLRPNEQPIGQLLQTNTS